jgi:hypothetical protein
MLWWQWTPSGEGSAAPLGACDPRPDERIEALQPRWLARLPAGPPHWAGGTRFSPRPTLPGMDDHGDPQVALADYVNSISASAARAEALVRSLLASLKEKELLTAGEVERIEADSYTLTAEIFEKNKEVFRRPGT